MFTFGNHREVIGLTKKVCCVVPIYNVREFLPDCLDSLAAQTLGPEGLQVVLVDDGSTDGSSQIADEYAQRYENFEVHHIENGGLGHARNYGVKFADATYVCFADSDDVILPYAYEEMYELGEKNGTDLVVGDVVRFNSKKEYVSQTQRRAFVDAVELMHITTHPNLINDTTAWNKLFRKSFYDKNDLFWAEGIKYEDIPVTIPAHYLANGVSYLNKVVYKWRSRDNSAQSITQQRVSDPRNFLDRMTVLSMVDEFFERQHLDETQCLVKDVHWLKVDLALYVNDCLIAPAEYCERVIDAVAERLEKIDPRAFDEIDAIDRIKYRAVALRDANKLVEVLRFRKRGMKTLRVRQDARSGHWYGNFPFAWCDHSLMDMTNELSRSGLRQRILSVRLDDEHGLTVTGRAFSPYVGEFLRSKISQSAHLIDKDRHEVCDVAISPVAAKKSIRVDLSRDYRRVVLRWRRHARYRCVVPLETLASLACGEYKILLSHSVGSLSCDPRPLTSPVKGEGPRPWSLLHCGRKYSVGYDPNFDLVIKVSEADSLVSDVSCDNGKVLLSTRDGEVAIDCASLEHGVVRKVDLDLPSVEPRYLELGDDVLSLRPNKDGGISLCLQPGGFLAESFGLEGGHLLRFRLRVLGGLRLATIERASFEGRSFGASVEALVRDVHVLDGHVSSLEVCLDLADARSTELMRRDVYELALWARDALGEGRRCRVFSASVRKPEKDNSCSHNGYRYWLGVRGLTPIVSVGVVEPWYEKSRRRKRVSGALLYPLFRLLPIRPKTVVLESYWATKTDCNPYAFYRWLDAHHPEYDCVIPVVDTRMPIEGRGRKVRYNSLAYRYELARAKYFVNNVNFPLWHKKRPGQVEIQTMHGTPLKTLGLDVKSDFPTEKSVEDFLYKCRRWDYLVVQGKACEDITRSCYRYEGTYLETGYPRNDELFEGNNPTTILELKRELGLDPTKKLVLYAPTWRIKNRFDLKLDLARMCDELGDEYQIALRVHHLSSAGLNRASLGSRVVDLTFAKSISELYLVTDILITDYSSVMFDYATLRRPMLFYPYDLEDYRDNLRGFNIDLESEAPGPLLFSTEDVIDAIKNLDETVASNQERYDTFVEKYIEFERGEASSAIFEQVFCG